MVGLSEGKLFSMVHVERGLDYIKGFMEAKLCWMNERKETLEF